MCYANFLYDIKTPVNSVRTADSLIHSSSDGSRFCPLASSNKKPFEDLYFKGFNFTRGPGWIILRMIRSEGDLFLFQLVALQARRA